MRNNLKYFEGKICSIITGPSTRIYNEMQHANVFVGLVDEVTEQGIWVVQPSTRNKSFFTAQSLVGIVEETVTTMSNEEAKKVEQELNNRIPEKKPGKLISMDSIKELKKRAG